ncbi:hypothetical protein V2S66_22690 [Streptomyces sp. V4-01]|uniref:Polysaccharide chain length determinant N-terminal domain-containing protein n=1 Tax=Actinacidiphila polyblastidii TaxID=3110430 RepID=A0ABU7PI62_9ACTN|nr:hypothetical protein [Streptomyces sp. V4-01]
MGPEDVVRALLRRWYVLLLALVLTAAGAYHELHPRPEYQSSAVVVLRPPVTGNQPNQYANLLPPVAFVSYGVVQQLQSSAGAAELRAAGVTGVHRLLPRNSGTSVTPAYVIPSLQIQAEQPDPTTADAMVHRIITVYTEHVNLLQDTQHVAPVSRMSVQLLVPPNAVLMTGSRSRALAGVGLIGLLGGTLCTLWTDRSLLRRAARRAGREDGRTPRRGLRRRPFGGAGRSRHPVPAPR